jgi:hypothetical protein
MWDAWDLNDPQHNATFDDPDRYSFVDISQNNHNSGQVHWDRMQAVRARIKDSGRSRPINTVKIYGANSGRFGTHRDAQERFWRNLLGGLAATRFHRPPSGLGLSDLAQAHLKAARLLLSEVDLIACVPDNALLHNRSPNEAYCSAKSGLGYAVFFPDGGDVMLDVSATSDAALNLRWLDIRAGQWQEAVTITADGEGMVRLQTPEISGYWLGLVRVDS